MTSRTSGYATLTVASLMAAISLIAVAVMNSALAHAKLNKRAEQVLMTDVELESQMHITLAGLVNGTIKLDESVTRKHVTSAEQSFVLTIEEEVAKANVLNPDKDALSATLQEQFGTYAASEIMAAITRNSVTLGASLEDVLDGAILPENPNCFRRRLTSFHSSLPPTRKRYPRHAADGAILTVRVETSSTAPQRGLEASVLLTGRRDAPASVLSWRRYSPQQEGRCEI